MISYYNKSHGLSWKTEVLNYLDIMRFWSFKCLGIGAIRVIRERDMGYFPNSTIPSNGYLPLEHQLNDEVLVGNLKLFREKESFDTWVKHNSLIDMFSSEIDTLDSSAGIFLAKIYLDHIEKYLFLRTSRSSKGI